jgi:hypothetical protein
MNSLIISACIYIAVGVIIVIRERKELAEMRQEIICGTNLAVDVIFYFILVVCAPTLLIGAFLKPFFSSEEEPQDGLPPSGE